MNKHSAPVFLFFSVALVYVMVATKGSFIPHPVTDYFNPLATAILRGQLHINFDLRNVYDLVEFQNRWYLPWGPLVAFFLIPLQLLTHGYVHPLYLSVFFGALNVVVVFFLLERIQKDFFPGLSPGDIVWLIVFFAFGTNNFYLGTQGGVWYVDQVVASFFGNLGIYVIFKKKRVLRDYFIATTLISASLTGRPTIVLLVVIPAFLFLLHIVTIRNIQVRLRSAIRGMFVFGIPLCLFSALFFLYNHLRFGNPFEYGYRYISESPELAWIRTTYGAMSLQHIPWNIRYMLFEFPAVSFSHGIRVLFNPHGNSIFFLTPAFLFTLFAWPVRIAGNRLVVDMYRSALWLGTTITMIPSLLIYSTGFVQLGYRYSHDVTMLLFLLSVFGVSGKVIVPLKASIAVSVLLYTVGVLRFA